MLFCYLLNWMPLCLIYKCSKHLGNLIKIYLIFKYNQFNINGVDNNNEHYIQS